MTAMEQVLAGTTDARVWAEAFAEHFDPVFRGDDAADYDETIDVLAGWFANAIERGRDAGHREAGADLPGMWETADFLGGKDDDEPELPPATPSLADALKASLVAARAESYTCTPECKDTHAPDQTYVIGSAY